MATNRTIWQYCEHCKDEKLFDYNTVTCKTCSKVPKDYKPNKKN